MAQATFGLHRSGNHDPVLDGQTTGQQSVTTQLGWFAAVTALAFALPYVGTTVLDLPHDVYLLTYFIGVAAALALYVTATSFDVKAFALQNWRLSVALGLASGAFVVWNVLANNDATPRPGGSYFGFEVLWRGLAYGTVDALLLTGFPGAIAFSLLNREVRGMTRRIAFAAVALALVIVITGAYHLGYEQFREDGIGPPETGNTIISLPLLVSLNPAGSIAAHSAMHVAAVTHAYETEVFLPPHVTAE